MNYSYALFHGIWIIINAYIIYKVVLLSEWEEIKKKKNLLTKEDDIPSLHGISIIKISRIKVKIILAFTSLGYGIICYVIYSFIGNNRKLIGVDDLIKNSIGYIFILYSIIINSINKLDNKTDKDIDDTTKSKDLLKLINLLTNTIKLNLYKELYRREKKAYNRFVRQQIQNINDNENKKNLFVLKVGDNTWESNLKISLEEFKENIANKVIMAYNSARFEESCIDICTKDFLEVGVRMIDIINLFYYCQRGCKNDNEENKEKFKKIKKEVKKLVAKTTPKEIDETKLRNYKGDNTLVNTKE